MSDLPCEIDDVIIRQLKRHTDHRGWLAELFRNDEIPENLHPLMAYLSITKPGISRGPHEHKKQTDIIYFLGDVEFELFLWDNRPDSNCLKRHIKYKIEADIITMIRIPPGVVHGYKNIGNSDGIIINCPNQLYGGIGREESVDEIRHEDSKSSSFRIP